MENKIIMKMKFGSHLYHMNNENSDTDYIGIVLPTAKQILMQEADFQISKSTGNDGSKNSADDIDEQYYSIMRFLKMASKGELHAIDTLHGGVENLIESTPLWDELVNIRSMFYTKDMKAYLGYIMKQVNKYGVKGGRVAVLEEAMNVVKEYSEYNTVEELFKVLPIGEHSKIIHTIHETIGEQSFYEICGRKFQSTNRWDYFLDCLQKIYDSYGHRAKQAKDNKNVDWKAVSHGFRCAYQAKYIYQDGGFTYPLPETKFLKDVKEGKLDYLSEVQPVLEDLVDEVMVLADESDFPEKVNMKEIENMILDIHKDIVKDYFNIVEKGGYS